MEFKKEYECCNFINDEVIISDSENEKVSESCLLEKGEKVTDLDLQLAAEIGKALLEKNRELDRLVRTTQEYAEEQVLRSQYFEHQTESLREAIEDQARQYELLENQHVELNDKHLQLEIDYKTLTNKNRRFWETIESLEKKCENYKFRLEQLENEKVLPLEHTNQTKSVEESTCDGAVVSNLENSFEGYSFEFEEEIDKLKKIIQDLRIQQGIDNIEKDELKAELEDISTENQLLQHQVSSLESEIEEWKRVSEKAYKYKQLAEKCKPCFDERLPTSSAMKSSTSKKLKSLSHEVLNEDPLCGASDLLAIRQKFLSSSVTHIHQPSKNLSVLSEMDCQYHDLVKRYEKLLSKYHRDADKEHDQERSDKVQRAIQTLSWDFKTFEFQSHLKKEPGMFDEQSSKTSEEIELENEVIIDYKSIFVEIFAKLRESRDFDPEKSTS